MVCYNKKNVEAPPSLVVLMTPTRKCLCEVHTACAAYAQHMRSMPLLQTISPSDNQPTWKAAALLG